MTGRTVLQKGRKALALLLLLAAGLPLFRLLAPERAGAAAAATEVTAGALHEMALWGTLSLLAFAAAVALVLPLSSLEGILAKGRRLLLAPAPATFGAGLATLSTSLGLGVALGVHRGLPRLLDEMAQLLHARYLLRGSLAGTLPDPAASRLIQNSLLVPEGWVSVYPPGHTALLAGGLLLDAPWVVGPVLLGVTALFTWLTLERLYPARPGTARLAGALVAVSPFLAFLGGSYLSHVSVAAAAAVTVWASIRGWHGAAAWTVLAGAAAGFAVTARPWSGLVLGAFLTGGVLLGAWWREGRSVRWLGVRGFGTLLGALPFGVILALWNRRLFGSPFRFGYEAAFGPAHGLGFHPDPWGNLYGLREAVGYTSADLGALGLHLLETPLSAVAVVALFLLVVPRLSPATRILSMWALLPVAANAFYWHHGYHLGPRMLLEAAPAWAALTGVAAVGLVRGGRDPGEPGVAEGGWATRYSSSLAFWTLVLAVPAGAFLLLPSRIEAYRWDPVARAVSLPPDVPAEDGPALVFVHGTWAGRVGARLAAAGVRRDSVETALRRNGLCRVQRWADARAPFTGEEPGGEDFVGGDAAPSRGAAPGGAAASPDPLELTPRPGTPAHLSLVTVAPGNVVRVDPAASPDERCARELRSDRLGFVELAPLLWQTPLPDEGGEMLLVRDLGPEGNAPMLARYPGRSAWVWARTGPEEPPALIRYDEGMELLWGEELSRRPGPGSPAPRRSGSP